MDMRKKTAAVGDHAPPTLVGLLAANPDLTTQLLGSLSLQLLCQLRVNRELRAVVDATLDAAATQLRTAWRTHERRCTGHQTTSVFRAPPAFDCRFKAAAVSEVLRRASPIPNLGPLEISKQVVYTEPDSELDDVTHDCGRSSTYVIKTASLGMHVKTHQSESGGILSAVPLRIMQRHHELCGYRDNDGEIQSNSVICYVTDREQPLPLELSQPAAASAYLKQRVHDARWHEVKVIASFHHEMPDYDEHGQRIKVHVEREELRCLRRLMIEKCPVCF